MKSRSGTIVLVLATVWTVVGCSGSSEQASNPPSSKPSTSSAQHSPGANLVGIWFGRGVVDEASLENHLNSIADPTQKQNVRAMAHSFMTTNIAIQFARDGTMEMDVEIRATDGRKLRETTGGTWNVVEETENRVTVETVENSSGGPFSTRQVQYEFVGGRDQMRMPAPVSPELKAFQPYIVFERQTLTDEDMVETAKRPDAAEMQ